MSDTGTIWFEFVIRLGIGSTLITLFGLLSILALRFHSAATRHLVGTLACLALLAFPFATALLPIYRLGLFENRIAVAGESQSGVPVVDHSSSINNKLPNLRKDQQIGTPSERQDPVSPSSMGLPTSDPSHTTSSILPFQSALQPSSIPASPIQAKIMLLLFSVYSCGLAIGFLRIWYSHRSVEQLRATARPLSDPSKLLIAEECRRALDLDTQTEILLSDQVAVPLVGGVWSPFILLPETIVQWPMDRVRSAITHELAHVARRDLLALLLTRIATVLYWPQPLVMLLARVMRSDREAACDDRSIACISHRSQYARHLLDVALCMQDDGRTNPASLAMARSHRVECRIAAILSMTRTRTPPSARFVVWILFLSSAVSIGAAIVSPFSNIGASRTSAQESNSDNSPEQGSQRAQVIGVVRDEAGRPIKGARLLVAFSIATERPAEMHRYIQDSQQDGSYRFSDTAIDLTDVQRIFVRAFAKGHAIQQRNFFAIPKDDKPIVVDFELRKAPLGHALVLDHQRQPFSGVRLRSISTDGVLATRVWMHAEDWEAFGIPVPTSGTKGEVAVPPIDGTGKRDLVFEHHDYANTPVWKVQPDGQPVRIVMEKGEVVKFEVTCESDPEAVAESVITAHVSEDAGFLGLSFPVDSTGKVTARLRNRHTTIRIEHPSLAGMPWYHYSPARREMKFSLHKTGTVRGRVVNSETGEGAPKVSVHIATDRNVIKQPRTDANGFYETQIAVGSYSVKVSRYETLWKPSDQQQTVNVQPAETVTIPDLVLSPKPPIRGQVVLASGEPVPRAILIAGFHASPVLADHEGRFELSPRLKPKVAIAFHVLHPYEGLSRVFPVKKEDNNLQIELAAEGSVVGIVTDQRGQPLSDLIVSLDARLKHGRSGYTSTTHRRVLTRDDGTFRCLGLSPGFGYQVAVKGRSQTLGSPRRIVSNNYFEVLGERQERKVLKVDHGLLEEARELSRSRLGARKRLVPLMAERWLDVQISRTELQQKRFVMLCFARSTLSLKVHEVVHQLYANNGVQVVGVVQSALNPAERNRNNDRDITFPVAIDNLESGISDRFKIPDSPIVLVYDHNGELRKTLFSGENAVVAIRNLLLYGG